MDAPERTAAEQDGGRLKTYSAGCLVFAAVLALVGLGLNMRAGGDLDGRLVAVQAELAKRRDATEQARPVLIGAATEGNARVDYDGVEWAFAAGDPELLRPSWRAARPTLPDDIDAIDRQLAGPRFETALGGELAKHMEEGVEPSAAALAQFERFRPLIRLVQRGVTREGCDWAFPWEAGLGAEAPNGIAMRSAAILMAYEAHRAEEASAAADLALAIVAFGQDLMRHPSVMGPMMGLAARLLGLTSLERTLRRPDLQRADAARILKVLSAVETPNLERYAQAEHLATQVTLLNSSDRRLSPLDSSSEAARKMEESVGVGGIDFFLNRELTGLDEYSARAQEVCGLPYPERGPAQEAMQADLTSSWYLLANVVIPNLAGAQDLLDEGAALVDIVRVLAAAQLHRLERGAFPAELSALEGSLGGAPKDPFDPSGGPLRYAVVGDEVRCYSVYENGVDDGGGHRAEKIRKPDGDMVLVTSAGKPSSD